MIILQILKIAGIVLLCVLGFVLLLIVLLLVLPWRYKVHGTVRNKEYEAGLQISWMFRVIYLEQNFKSGEEGGGKLRIFGLRLFRSRKEVLEEQKRLREERKPDPEVLRQVGASSSLFEDPVQNELKQYQSDISGSRPGVREDEIMKASSERTTEEAGQKTKISLQTIREMWKNGRAPQPEELVHMLEQKLEVLIQRILTYTNRQAKVIVKNGKSALLRLFNESKESLDKLNELKNLLFGTENREEMLYLLRIVRRVSRQILPREGKGILVFGIGDPYYTGKILEFLAVLFPVYGEVIQVCPWFDGEKLEADADVSGHFHLIVLLVSFLNIWFNKKLRNIYTEFMRIITDERSE